MPTPGLVSVDAEGLLVTWLNTLTTSLVGVGQPLVRGFFFELQRSPGKDAYAVTTRIQGADGIGSEVPTDMARISTSIFSTTKKNAAAAAVAYANALRSISIVKPTLTGVTIRLADNIAGPTWVPNLDKNLPQYLVDADVHFHSAT